MSRKHNLFISITAGLVGGALGKWVPIGLVHAQGTSPTIVSAQIYRLINQENHVVGTFSVDRRGKPNLTLFDNNGNVIWRAIRDDIMAPAVTSYGTASKEPKSR